MVPRRTFPITIVVIACAIVVARSFVFVRWGYAHFDSDQAVFGLAAMDIAAGRAWPFYLYGQQYLFPIAAWLAAPLFVGWALMALLVVDVVLRRDTARTTILRWGVQWTVFLATVMTFRAAAGIWTDPGSPAAPIGWVQSPELLVARAHRLVMENLPVLFGLHPIPLRLLGTVGIWLVTQAGPNARLLHEYSSTRPVDNGGLLTRHLLARGLSRGDGGYWVGYNVTFRSHGGVVMRNAERMRITTPPFWFSGEPEFWVADVPECEAAEPVARWWLCRTRRFVLRLPSPSRIRLVNLQNGDILRVIEWRGESGGLSNLPIPAVSARIGVLIEDFQ